MCFISQHGEQPCLHVNFNDFVSNNNDVLKATREQNHIDSVLIEQRKTLTLNVNKTLFRFTLLANVANLQAILLGLTIRHGLASGTRSNSVVELVISPNETWRCLCLQVRLLIP